MAQFDVYRNPNPATRGRIPFVLDVQAALLESLATEPQELAGIPRKSARQVGGNVARERTQIIGALDFAFTGI